MTSRRNWNYVLAEQIIKLFKNRDEIVFEAGFTPSGYPHVGTYAELIRPWFVMRAVQDISDKKVKYIFGSCDMDGLKQVPAGMPDLLYEYLGKPLRHIPDPWGCCPSFPDHQVNHALQWLTDQGIRCDEFMTTHDAYKSGLYNDAMRKILDKHEMVSSIMHPTLREETKKDWSPFMPICAKCGRILTTRVVEYFPRQNALRYVCDRNFKHFSSCGHEGVTSIFNGNVKTGFKIEWALFWSVYGINVSLGGKDILPTFDIAREIMTKVLGGKAPYGAFFELFENADGEKISKSTGNGFEVNDWLRFAPREALNLLMYKSPHRAKRFYDLVIPHYVDKYLDLMHSYYEPSSKQSMEENALKHQYYSITNDASKTSPYEYHVSFSLLTRLIAAIGDADLDVISRYVHKLEGRKSGSDVYLRMLIKKAKAYVSAVLQPQRVHYKPSDIEISCLCYLIDYLRDDTHHEDDIQTQIFIIAFIHDLAPGDLFRCVYKLLCGHPYGPRLGSLIKLMGERDVADRLNSIVHLHKQRVSENGVSNKHILVDWHRKKPSLHSKAEAVPNAEKDLYFCYSTERGDTCLANCEHCYFRDKERHLDISLARDIYRDLANAGYNITLIPSDNLHEDALNNPQHSGGPYRISGFGDVMWTSGIRLNMENWKELLERAWNVGFKRIVINGHAVAGVPVPFKGTATSKQIQTAIDRIHEWNRLQKGDRNYEIGLVFTIRSDNYQLHYLRRMATYAENNGVSVLRFNCFANTHEEKRFDKYVMAQEQIEEFYRNLAQLHEEYLGAHVKFSVSEDFGDTGIHIIEEYMAPEFRGQHVGWCRAGWTLFAIRPDLKIVGCVSLLAPVLGQLENRNGRWTVKWNYDNINALKNLRLEHGAPGCFGGSGYQDGGKEIVEYAAKRQHVIHLNIEPRTSAAIKKMVVRKRLQHGKTARRMLHNHSGNRQTVKPVR